MAKKQYYGIKFPFKNEGFQHFYLDANETVKDKVRSQLMHVIFTPKGQYIRNPEFGTDLIKFIFDQNDSYTWESVKNEVTESVSRWVKDVKINDISVVTSYDDDTDMSQIYVRIDYSVVKGNSVVDDSIGVKL